MERVINPFLYWDYSTYRFSVWFFILEKKQRNIFWFLSFFSRADIKPREGGKKGTPP
jgi:hypothetical protein